MYTCLLAQKLYWERYEVVNFLLLFSLKLNSLKGYFIVCKCSVRLCLHDSRVEICGVFTRGGLESSAKSSTSRFPTICIYFLEKGVCQVHDEPFESSLNCFHAVFSIFQPGLNSQPGLLIQVKIQPGLSYKQVIDFMCVSS